MSCQDMEEYNAHVFRPLASCNIIIAQIPLYLCSWFVPLTPHTLVYLHDSIHVALSNVGYDHKYLNIEIFFSKIYDHNPVDR